MTWILMEIPCHFMSQIDSSLVQTDNKFHENSMSFIHVLFVFQVENMTWVLYKFKSWNFHGTC